MAAIIGKIIDANNIPIPNVVVLLNGGGVTPQATITAIDGSFTFANQLVGTYKLSAIDGRKVVEKVVDITTGQVNNTVADFKIIPIPYPRRILDYLVVNRFVLLKYGQYAFLAAVGWLFFNKLVAERIPDLSLTKLSDIEMARGAITYLIAVTTISMAALLMLAAIMTGGKDLDKRFTLGKEILTLLIGILGTIIGFYYGSSDKSGMANSIDKVKIDTLMVSQSNNEVIIQSKISGGVSPFIYSISTMPDDIITHLTDKFTVTGEIRDTLRILNELKGEKKIKITLKGRDNNKINFDKTREIKLAK